MDQLEQFVSELVLDVSKAVLKHPQLDLFHESETELLLFLYIYFQKQANKLRQEESIAISVVHAKVLLDQVLNSSYAGAPKKKKSASPSPSVLEDQMQLGCSDLGTNDAPVVQLRTLREQLTQHRINVAAFSEVVEMCRFLDQAQAPNTPLPFGTVNILHFVALYVTLCPVQALVELVDCVISSSLSDTIKVKIFYLWSLVDYENQPGLQKLCKVVHDHPGITMPLLADLFPMVQHLHTPAYRHASAAPSGPTQIIHSEDAEVPGAPSACGAPETVEEDAEDYSNLRSAEDQAFWANLVADTPA